MLFRKCSAALLFLAACVVSAAFMPFALEGYIHVKGTKQGAFKGAGSQGTHVLEVRTSIVSPRDPQSGLPTGKRMHKPVVMVIARDASAPQFERAAKENEHLQEVTVDFTARGGQAPEKLTLIDAVISSIKTTKNGDLEISFLYEKIEWTHTGGKKTFNDDWTQ